MLRNCFSFQQLGWGKAASRDRILQIELKAKGPTLLKLNATYNVLIFFVIYSIIFYVVWTCIGIALIP